MKKKIVFNLTILSVSAIFLATFIITSCTKTSCNKEEVKVTNVTLNKMEITLAEGESDTLAAYITPENATNKKVNWTSDNAAVATVDDAGIVSTFKAGEANITVMTEDGNKSATCSITVTSTITVNGVSFSMVYVRGGTFRMGAQSDDPDGQNYDPDADDWENPVHQVTLSDYYIGQYEVTQELWQAVIGDEPSYCDEDSKYPVEKVSWDEIVNDFLPKLNRMTGKTFVLPTEAQWEFAARGGLKSKGYKYSGSNNIYEVAWHAADNSHKKSHPVGQKQPNELGIYDMSGNIYEWCSDCFGNYSAEPQTDPQGPEDGDGRVLRGGSWNYDDIFCSVSSRINGFQDYNYYIDSGFRLALLP